MGGLEGCKGQPGQPGVILSWWCSRLVPHWGPCSLLGAIMVQFWGFFPLSPRLDSEGIDLLTNLLLVSAGQTSPCWQSSPGGWGGGVCAGEGQLERGRATHPAGGTAGRGRGAQMWGAKAQRCPDVWGRCTEVPRCAG